MFDKVSGSMNFVDREKEITKFWNENKIFEKSYSQREKGETFTFYDGPPTANGMPHIGHVLTRVIKDLIPRYQTMKGKKIIRKAGWDTHGLPVELEVEKKLGISGKPQIEGYGVEEFCKLCKESVWKYTTVWKLMSDKVGYWVDMDNPYVTYHNNYIESEWWALKTIADKGLLYKGHKIVPYCPRCGTSLSSHEVAQGYKDVKETSVFVKFAVCGEKDTYFLAWTTTPWTLPSNVALAVNPNECYVKVKYGDEYLILAHALCSILEEEFEVVEEYNGKDLEFKEYSPLFDFAKPKKKCYYVTCADYVTLTDGTGIVHIAPAFGEDDSQVGRRYDLPFVQLVDEAGKLTKECGEFAGLFVKDADKPVIKNLRERNLLFKTLNFEHSYPFCWRCDTPLIYYARDTWFIKMTEVRDRLIANNNSINWIPENIKTGRMGNFLENVVDWGLSRSRYWGTPLPVWECPDCGHYHVIGSIEELKKLGKDVPDDIELHKCYVDKITIKCDKCGSEMHRAPEVIDCWFDSGSMPFAQWHYPFENKEIFDDNFPANFISEAIDQTRGWFYTLLAISTLLFDKAPFKNCIVLGHVNDKDGIKMSKHKGNVIAPDTVLDVQGSDAVRWYFYSASAPWLPSRFYPEAVSESQRKFLGTLWNTYSFFILYANIDNFDPSKYELEYDKLSVMDKWILSKLNSLVRLIDGNLAQYKITESARAIQDFTDGLSNWYIRRGRERYWASGMEQDKINAYMTLYTVLVTMSKLCAPFIPFMTEQIYQNLVRSVDKNAPESVHLCDFPVCDESMINEKIEESMDKVVDMVVLGRACRNGANVKNRQPIAKMYVQFDGDDLDGEYMSLIADELNAKACERTYDSEKFVNYKYKPQLKTLGRKYGKLIPAISAHLANVEDGKAVMAMLKQGEYSFEIDGEKVSLSIDDVLVETVKEGGYVSESDKGITVVLDINLTPELIDEGFVRELVNKIQTMRKEAGFEVMDHIKVTYEASDVVENVFAKYGSDIASDVLANELCKTAPCGYVKDWDINGEKAKLGVEKL